MKFQKSTEYAIRVMVYLANHGNQWYSANRLHKELDIPYKFLGRLLNVLTKGGLLQGKMGNQGGYKVNEHRSDIYLYEVIGVIEGLDNYNRCVLGFPECSEENPCPMHAVWMKQQEGLRELVYNVSLRQLSKTVGKY